MQSQLSRYHLPATTFQTLDSTHHITGSNCHMLHARYHNPGVTLQLLPFSYHFQVAHSRYPYSYLLQVLLFRLNIIQALIYMYHFPGTTSQILHSLFTFQDTQRERFHPIPLSTSIQDVLIILSAVLKKGFSPYALPYI